MKVFANLRHLLLAGLLAAFCSAAAAQSVKVDYNTHVDFAQYHTYSWGQVRASNSLWEDRVRSAVDHALQSKALQMVPSGGDVTVSAIAVQRNHVQLQTYYSDGWGMGWGWRGWRGGPWFETTVPVNYEVGTLVLDLFNSSDKQLIWRASVSSAITSDNPEKNDKKVDQAAQKLVDKLPIKKMK